ncbi:type VI secretion system tube protein Hcp [Wenzhouxiangella sp. XN201]|uniref:type VI secretion system tube protein TssD n=1 Tax=Wenzhouxiangella sp. XN201 TaxID=2710755 RepID=UPI0013CD8BC7|nr:type VI secretion system tube protein Hcp [Wenzhouxiangella sp. XN201]
MNPRAQFRSITAVTLGLCAWAAVLMPTPADAALDAYAVIIGETQGEFKTDSAIPPHEGKIVIKAFGSSVSADYDPATGLPGTDQQHRPIRLLKDVDKASPLLLTAFKNSEKLLSVTLQFFRPTQAGGEENHVTIVLENAYIVGILPGHSSQAEDVNTPFRETISLTYESMTVIWESGGITGQINW